MIVTCPNCTTKLQLDAAKVPQRAFSVRCPKCQHIINAQPPAPPVQKEKDALAAVGSLPTSTRAQQESNVSAPAPGVRATAAESDVAAGDGEVVRLLTALLQRGAGESAGTKGVPRRPSWDRRRALVCLGSAQCEAVAQTLVDNFYEICVVGDAEQAAEQMREAPPDVVLVDQEFDAPAQGAVRVARELNSMRMSDRRRVVFVQLTNAGRTGDPQAAFLANSNLIINTSDLDNLIRALDKNIRELNDLYRDFNKALSLTEI